MSNTTTEIKILPNKALELLIAGLPPADILDAFSPTPDIPSMMDGQLVKNAGAKVGGTKGHATSRSMMVRIAHAEDLHAGFDDATSGTI